jgi:predicted kinase
MSDVSSMQTTPEWVPLLVVSGDEPFPRHSPTASAPPTTPARGESRSTIEDSSTGLQARRGSRKERLHLVLGPVGAGKSTFARKLATDHCAVRLTLDEWIAKLFSPDRPDSGVMEWYVERTARCIDVIWAVAAETLQRGTGVILEIGLLTRRERERFYERIDAAGPDLTIHVVDASRDVRRRRVEERNRVKGSTFSMVVPAAVFELASDLWEPPDATECEGRDVRFIRTDE